MDYVTVNVLHGICGLGIGTPQYECKCTGIILFKLGKKWFFSLLPDMEPGIDADSCSKSYIVLPFLSRNRSPWEQT